MRTMSGHSKNNEIEKRLVLALIGKHQPFLKLQEQYLILILFSI